jgi:hypothetical protein
LRKAAKEVRTTPAFLDFFMTAIKVVATKSSVNVEASGTGTANVINCPP